MSDARVIVAVPSGDMLHTSFAFSLAAAARQTKYRLGIVNARGSNIYRLRNKLVWTALDGNADYVLFIDSDMSFPPHAINRVVQEADENGRDILGCNYTARQIPHNQLVQSVDLKAGRLELKGVCEVGRLPTGFMLIARRVFEAIGEPWFRGDMKDPGDDQPLGEDYEFCQRATQHGFRIWVDTDLSLQLVHWGSVGFRFSATDPSGFDYVEVGE